MNTIKDIIKIGVVNFRTEWGNKEKNTESMISYCKEAAKQGVNLILFPETALTGYDNDKEHVGNEKMHIKLAENIHGKTTEKFSKIAKEFDMYIVFGMSEKDNSGKVFNSAAIVSPDGEISSYRKIHLPFDEKEWAEKSDEPKTINSKWGKIGITICYDTYCFPELIRYYRAKGARLILNATACPDIPCTMGAAKLSLPAYAFINYVFIASANICGKEIRSHFTGGSCVIGPDETKGNTKVYAGKMFGEEGCDKEGLITCEIDLSLADKNTDIPIFNGDWSPKIYNKMYSEFT